MTSPIRKPTPPFVSLLPLNATPFERAFERAASRATSHTIPIRWLWNPDLCPTYLLPWLAWQLGVDVWSSDWSEKMKRETIRTAAQVHRRKGTVWAIRRALEAAGYPEATIQEGGGGAVYDGALTYDGTSFYAPGDHWAEYRVRMAAPITNRRAAVARRIIEAVAPLRCHLKVFDFTEVAHSYDGTITYNGAYNYGAA